jgi:O-antigen ligase
VSFGLCLTAIAYTASRGPVLAVCCALALAAVLRPRHVLLPVLALVIALAVTVPRLSEDYLDRFQSLASVVAAPSTQAVTSAPEDSLESRLAEYIAALQMFADHPFLGVGYGNYPVRYLDYAQEIGLEKKPGPRTPHSLVLEALSETGVVGTVALLSVLGAAFAGAWRARSVLDPHGAALAEGTFVALAAFVVASLFLHAATLRWVLVPVGLALAAGQIGRTASSSGRAAGVR